MGVYQSIHSGNQIRICGKANVAAANQESEYRLGELALPGKRRPPALHHVRHSVKMFWQAFFQLFSSPYRRTTLTLGGILLFSTAIQFYLSSYVPATVLKMESQLFEASRQTEANITYDNQHYNQSLENIQFTNVTFTKCIFRDMLMSHVQFRNCTFNEVALSNVKTSNTYFKGCIFLNTTIIDTDMEYGRELDTWCVLNNSVVVGMRGGCGRHADLRSRLAGLVAEQAYVAQAALVASLPMLRPTRFTAPVVSSVICILLSPSIYLVEGETGLYIVEAVYRLFLTLIFYSVCFSVVESYPANLRCTAFGVLLSVSYMGGAFVRGVGVASALPSAALCCLFAAAAAGLAAPNAKPD